MEEALKGKTITDVTVDDEEVVLTLDDGTKVTMFTVNTGYACKMDYTVEK